MLVDDEQVTMPAVPAGVAQSNHVHRVYVDEQWHFALAGLAPAVWTARDAMGRIRVHEEVVFRRQPANPILFHFWHATLLKLLASKPQKYKQRLTTAEYNSAIRQIENLRYTQA